MEDLSMKNSMLRAPLIKSAVLLAVFSLIIYLTISSPEGSVWNSLQAVLYTVFKAAQLGVGLVLALALCFAVLGGIFFGCVAMISTDSARRMYNDLQGYVAEKTEFVKSLIGQKVQQGGETVVGELTASLRRDIEQLQASVNNLIQTQKAADENIAALRSRVEQGEQEETVTKLSDWLREEEEKSAGMQASLDQLDVKLQQVQEQVDSLGRKIQDVPAKGAFQEITGRTAALESRNSDLLSAVNVLQEKLDSLGTELQTALSTTAESGGEQQTAVHEQENEDEHRLFSYIKNSGEKEKVRQLVRDTLDKDMTYAQVIEHVSGNVGKKTTQVLADHPSLTKEYIREARKRIK